MFLADRNLPGVWQISPEGKLSLYFEGSKKFRTPLNAIRCVAVDSQGRILAGDSSTTQVYRFDDQKQPQPLVKGRIGIPMAIAFDSQKNILVTDLELHQLLRIPDAGGEAVRVTNVIAPRGLTVDKEDHAWVIGKVEEMVDGKKARTNAILKIAPDGTSTVVAKGEPLDFPHTIALDDEGNAYVVDNYAKALWKIDSKGTIAKLVQGEPFKSPVGLCRQGDRLLVADPHAKAVFGITFDGMVAPVKLEP